MNLSKIEEILVIAQEECAEVIQVISKMHRFGIGHEHVSSGQGTNVDVLNQEVGDLLAMLDLLREHGILDDAKLAEAKANKIAKLKVWSNIFKEEQNPN